jgi:TadE-like protein
MVEFALVAPLLFMVIFGMIDFGRAFHYLNVEQQLANEGARLAAVNPKPPFTCPDKSTASNLAQYIQCQADTQELRSGGTTWIEKGAKVCITFPNGGTPIVGDPVKVSVSASYKYLPIDWIKSSSPPTATTITGTATMRLEAAPTNYTEGCYQP